MSEDRSKRMPGELCRKDVVQFKTSGGFGDLEMAGCFAIVLSTYTESKRYASVPGMPFVMPIEEDMPTMRDRDGEPIDFDDPPEGMEVRTRTSTYACLAIPIPDELGVKTVNLDVNTDELRLIGPDALFPGYEMRSRNKERAEAVSG